MKILILRGVVLKKKWQTSSEVVGCQTFLAKLQTHIKHV